MAVASAPSVAIAAMVSSSHSFPGGRWSSSLLPFSAPAAARNDKRNSSSSCRHRSIAAAASSSAVALDLGCFLFCRRNVMVSMISGFVFSQLGHHQVALADSSVGLREHIDTFDGYTFLYPQNWIQVRGAGADVFFRDPFILDENISVELSSPSSSRYKSVGDLGSPDVAAQKVLKQYLTEFMSTRLGVRRESNILSASSRLVDDGRVYYQVEVNIKSYASTNELAVMPQDRRQRLEWDRRYLSVLGVENNRLYELRLQTPESVFLEEEKDLRQVMNSFRVIKAVS